MLVEMYVSELCVLLCGDIYGGQYYVYGRIYAFVWGPCDTWGCVCGGLFVCVHERYRETETHTERISV